MDVTVFHGFLFFFSTLEITAWISLNFLLEGQFPHNSWNTFSCVVLIWPSIASENKNKLTKASNGCHILQHQIQKTTHSLFPRCIHVSLKTVLILDLELMY